MREHAGPRRSTNANRQGYSAPVQSLRHATRRARWPALAIAALTVGAALLAPSRSLAQPGRPSPPNRFYGVLLIYGQPAPVGTMVSAQIGGVKCAERATSDPGRYQLDVPSTLERSSCGTPGATVHFQVGTSTIPETATWTSGRVTRFDLNVGGASGPASAAPAPAAAPIPSATPPPPPPGTTARLDLSSPCIPAGGDTACDDTRRRLWAADAFAWASAFAAQGKPEPSPEQVFDEALRMRLVANDPAAMGAVAKVLGWPHVRITAVRFLGTAPRQADEWVEVTNLGGGPQSMDGWFIRAQPSGAQYSFPPDVTLDPGRSCRVYSSEPGPNACGGTATFGRDDVWDDSDGAAQLIYAPLDLTADSTRYSAGSQLPPPNLRLVQ